ncbi:MAG: F0F1 ATP synthase subunit A [Candidatus Eremiobacteraeota bacterium]|nr:F0F1 ATP synthase subunit A [Candidatus Eremiobacteraeota bacterium]
MSDHAGGFLSNLVSKLTHRPDMPTDIEWFTVKIPWLPEYSYDFYGITIQTNTLHLDTLVMAWLVMAIIIVVAIITRKSIRWIPGNLQGLFEHIYFYFCDLGDSLISKDASKYVPFVMTIFIFVLACNWIALIPGFIPPTRDYNTTLAFAIISFFGFTYFGIMKNIREEKGHYRGIKGTLLGFWHWVLHFIEPLPSLWGAMEGAMKWILCPFLFFLFLGLNIIEELLRILSLSIRLMGNIMGEHMVLGVLLWLTLFIAQGWLKPVNWLTSVFVGLLGALTGFIQAFIFAVLTLAYIAGAVEGH